ncbi:ATG4 [Lepeophtheirus salmonis]|uniref:Cysteine protease n=1 Tax=Lepeophtheirus salmonis TaxID=72036 RepID=A0A7R8CWE8_LEPSM|nr:ATG4 [Lepeophtheirus salmonis]CAF2951701.1 ATG4 [Lepeophtheirus salmonis]
MDITTHSYTSSSWWRKAQSYLHFMYQVFTFLRRMYPHLVQDQVDTNLVHFDLKTFHCNTPKKMSVFKMDPSCCKAADCVTNLGDLLSRSLSMESNPDEEFVNIPQSPSTGDQSVSEDFVFI